MAMLNPWPMGFYAPSTLVHQARRDGVRVLGPCMREGGWDCEVVPEVGPRVALQGGASRGVASRGGASSGAEPESEPHVEERPSGEPPSDRPPPAAPPGSEAPPPSPTRGTIRVGWRHIRGLGPRAEEALQVAREAGPFTSIEDVVKRAALSRAE